MPAWNSEAFRNWLLSPEDNQDDLDEVVDEFGNEALIVEVVTDVCQNWREVAKEFSVDHQNRCLWRIISNPLFIGHMFSRLDIKNTVEFIRAAKQVTLAIPFLIPEGEPMENGYFMWWDCLVDSNDVRTFTDVCLEILTDLLNHSDERVSYAALHGLGHLDHPDRPKVIDAFICRNPDLADDPWVLQCRNGTVM